MPGGNESDAGRPPKVMLGVGGIRGPFLIAGKRRTVPEGYFGGSIFSGLS